MKLLFAIVQDEDTKSLIRALVEHDISVTRISSSGGFLRGGNSTLMIGVEKDKADLALDIIKRRSSARRSVAPPPAGLPDSVAMPVAITVGGATVFQVDVEQFYKY